MSLSMNCCFRADCRETECPGRAMAITAEELAAGQRALHTEDGGTWLTTGHRVFRMRPDQSGELDPPLLMQTQEPESSPRTEAWAKYIGAVIGACVFLYLVASCGVF